MAKTTKIALVQMAVSPEPESNLAKACERVKEAAAQGAELICLPELFGAQYFCQKEDHAYFDVAEPIDGPTTQALARIAREKKVVITSSIFERRAAGLYHNTAVVLERDGSVAGVYRKMHIPDDPLYYEKFYFTPGDLGFRSFATSAGNVGTLICWDQWYPEGARLTALQGAEVLVYPTAIGWHPAEKVEYGEAQYSAWQTMQRSHAIANGVYVAAINRVGLEHGDVCGNKVDGVGIEFWGGSFIADPYGRVIAQAPHDAEAILYGEMDMKLVEEARRHWPFLRDRRVDAYGGITERYLDKEK